MGISALVIESEQRNLSNGAYGDVKRPCAPAPQLKDGEWEAPAKLACDSPTKRAELAGRQRSGIAASAAADNRPIAWRWWLAGMLEPRGSRAQR